jgi:hypothetical protein
LTIRVSGVDNTEIDIGQPVRFWRREYGCRNRWQSDVMASYDRDTDADEVQRFQELIAIAIATKRNLAKASIDPGRTSLLDFEDLKVRSTDRDDNAMDFFSTLTFRDCSRKFLLLLLPLG